MHVAERVDLEKAKKNLQSDLRVVLQTWAV